jgi:dolichol-phosphate mannosyltransferase
MYNEENNIPVLLERLRTIEGALKSVNFEFVFVDDNSSDRTYEQLKKLAHLLRNVKILRLAKNSGSHAAIMCGLLESRGDGVVFMAGDLQDPPELLMDMIKQWQSGYSVVWAARDHIEGQPLKDKLLSQGYWSVANFVCGGFFPGGGVDFALMDRKVVECITPLAHQDVPLFLLIAETGFTSTIVYYTKAKRGSGQSGWTLRKKLRAVNHTLLFSIKPIRILLSICFALGALTVVAASANLWTEWSKTQLLSAGAIALELTAIFSLFGLILFGAVTEFFARHLKALGALPRFIICRRDTFYTDAGPAEVTINVAPDALISADAPAAVS